MNKKIYTFLILNSAFLISFSQTTLYQNNFTSGPAGWQLGQGNAFNFWIVNNVYNCSYPTADQGGGNYMHVYDDLSPDYCATYVILGNGSGETVYSTMTTSFSTVGQPMVTIAFDWLCQGQTGPILASFGFVDYSTDGGNTWINTTQPLTRYNGQPAWTAATITSVNEPGLLNQPNLRLRFGFTTSGYGTNPSFAIDNIVITGSATIGVTEKISENTLTVFPNPNKGIVTVQNEEQITSVEVYNVLGEKVYAEFFSGYSALIDLSSHSNGIYFVKVISENTQSVNRLVLSK